MAKLIILSVVLMSFIVPIYLATSTRPKAALRRAQIVMVGFILLWAILCVRWYPELVPLK